jgi:hypothetical protein
MVLDIDGKNNKWYFKFGEPQNLNTVRVFGINLYEYLMFGNHIPMPNGFTTGFKNAYHGALGHYPGGSIGSGGVGGATQTGSGFALGIGFMFNHSDLKNLTGNYYLAYQLGAGAELHLAFMNYAGSCSGYNPIGINGWRASGGLGFYGTAGAQVKRIGGTLADKTWNLASLAAGAWIYGEFPNPYYAAGAVSGHAYILKIIDISFHKEFEVGSQCSNTPLGGGAPVVQGDVAADQQQKLIQYVNPTQTYNFPTTTPLAVKYGLIPDEVFDVSEQQANGTILNRTFKMQVTRTLQIKNENGSWSNVSLNTAQNNLGEHLYTTIGSLGPSTGLMFDAGTTGGSGTTTGTTSAGKTTTVFQTISNGGGATQAASGIQQTVDNGGTGLPGQDMAGMGLMLTYPIEPPPPSYGDLPPTTPAPTNNLLQDKDYKFVVTATLKEFKNGIWVNALKNNGSAVTQTVEKTFRTGPIQAVAPVKNLSM